MRVCDHGAPFFRVGHRLSEEATGGVYSILCMAVEAHNKRSRWCRARTKLQGGTCCEAGPGPAGRATGHEKQEKDRSEAHRRAAGDDRYDKQRLEIALQCTPGNTRDRSIVHSCKDQLRRCPRSYSRFFSSFCIFLYRKENKPARHTGKSVELRMKHKPACHTGKSVYSGSRETV